MSAAGFTPIQLYRSATASAAPSAGNLADGELAVNTLDEKLYIKNSSGVVKAIASTAATNLAAPPPIGNTTPNSGAFTSLSATGTTTLAALTLGGAVTGGGQNVSGVGTLSATTLSASGNGDFNTGVSGRVRSGTGTYGGQLEALGGGSGAIISITPNTISGANGVDYTTSFVSGGNGPHVFKVGSTEYARISSTGLAVTGALSATGRVSATTDTATPSDGSAYFYKSSSGGVVSGYQVILETGSAGSRTTKATLDTSGNLGLGVTPSAWGVFKAFEINRAVFASTGAETELGHNFYWNGSNFIYKSTDFATSMRQVNGQFRWFTAPSGTAGNAITFTQALTLEAAGHLLPGTTNNVENLGSATYRWATVYAGTGTINTSDAREKTDVVALSSAEINAAKQLSKEIGTYKFLASVQAKGADARTHVGMTVQRAIEIMEANGLEPFAYGFICFDSWDDKFVEHLAIEAVDAVLDEEGNITTPTVEAKAAWTEQTQTAGDRYAFRYDQLNMFIAAGIESRITTLEADKATLLTVLASVDNRLIALEAK